MIKKAKLSHENKVSSGIKRFSDLKIDDRDYDTFIWTKEILEPEEIDIWKKTIENEIKNGKNIYNMARLYRAHDFAELVELAKKYGVNVFDCSDPNKFEKLKDYAEMGLNGINGTVITIMGTGRQCGKFTTSMVLKKCLEKYYNVGIVGTEPQSAICGADEMVIPQVIPARHVASTIFGAIKKVDLENKDIIIVSGQTGIFSDPLEVGTGRGGGVISLSILLGSRPDFILLASNTADSKEIKRNINLVEDLTGKKVIGVTLNGKNISTTISDSEKHSSNNQNLEDIINKLNLELGIPVAEVIKGINLQNLVDEIVKNIK